MAEAAKKERIIPTTVQEADDLIAANKENYKVKSWSLSALNLYEECPRKFSLLRFEKYPTKPSYHLEVGIHVHSLAEQLLLGNIEGTPRELKAFEKEFKALKKHSAIPEEEVVLRNDWSQIEGNKKWFSKEAWFRAKIDATVFDGSLLIDFKTGRSYPEHEGQANLYATSKMANNSDLTSIDVEFWYMKTGDVKSYNYSSDDLETNKEMWNDRVSKMFSEKDWLPTEHQWCRYCEVKNLCPLKAGKSG